jgi:DNA modification methylase
MSAIRNTKYLHKYPEERALKGTLREDLLAATDSNSIESNYILFNEDCLLTAKRIPDSAANLVYVDPPFFSGRNYRNNQLGFNDKWINISEYIAWVTPRLQEFRRILSDNGTVYIHCDWHASHYLKVLADKIFGQNHFLNEIIWKRQSSHNDARQGSRHFGRVHDTILLYSKSRNYIWNQQYTPYNPIYVKKAYRFTDPQTGRKYALGDLSGPGGASKNNSRYSFLGFDRYWRFSRDKMLQLLSNDRIHHAKGRIPLLKRYLDEMLGKPFQDVWDDVQPVSHSRQDFGYPTQKPEGLLERIIRTSSNPNDLIYDPFAGSGTCAAVGYSQSRKYIGSEISARACRVILNRMAALNCRIDLRCGSPASQLSPTCKRLSQRIA